LLLNGRDQPGTRRTSSAQNNSAFLRFCSAGSSVVRVVYGIPSLHEVIGSIPPCPCALHTNTTVDAKRTQPGSWKSGL
jgi:hypothetical protein